ncbi:MAG: hypothetical protein A3G25_07550 [Betaproteobacteria bacterium RIFCSPLOWO2_12_FULL_63_13]|nr:MAG: hypothetical protein A3G25_07550 [Betaproteobacteria bacterium RIFCSPLOWO2_12_FULL_63_13]
MTRRLKPIDGEIAVAAHSRQNGDMPPPCSSTRFAMRNSASPKNEPATPLAIWSFIEGGVRSPATSQSALPANVYAAASQYDRPADLAKPWYIEPWYGCPI